MARDGDAQACPQSNQGRLLPAILCYSPSSPHSHPLYNGFPPRLAGYISIETNTGAQ